MKTSSNPSQERGEASRVDSSPSVENLQNTGCAVQAKNMMTSSQTHGGNNSQQVGQNADHESGYVNVERDVQMNEYEKVDSSNDNSQNVYEQITST